MLPLFVFGAALLITTAPQLPQQLAPMPASVAWGAAFACWLLSAGGGAWFAGRTERRMRETGRIDPLRRLAPFMLAMRVLAIVGLAVPVLLSADGRTWLADVVAAWLRTDIILPTLLPLVACWVTLASHCWSEARIDHLLEEGTALSEWLDGRPADRARSRRRLASILVRSEILLFAIPLALLLSLAQGIEALLIARGVENGSVVVGAQLAGAVGLLAFSPLLLARVLPTRAIGETGRVVGAVARAHGVRLWRVMELETMRGQINAAVVGPAGWRLVLLTDGAIGRLAPEQLRAVAAHEVAHLRRRHLPWAMLAVGGLAGGSATLIHHASALVLGDALAASGVVVSLQAALVLAVTLAGLGFVSRRFEREADASAVAFNAREEGRDRIEASDAEPLTGALLRVCAVGGLPARKWTWRHGSVSGRCDAARALAGARADARDLPAGGLLWRLGIASLAGLALVAGLLTDWPV